MERFKNSLNRCLGYVCIFLFAFMTVIGTYQIVTRYFFNAPSTVSEELLTFSFTWLALLAAALVFGKREHMRMSFVADKLSPRAQIITHIISEVLILIFAALILLYGGIRITNLTMSQITASLGIPMGVVYMVLPLSGVLVILYNILNIIELKKEFGEKEVSK